MTKKTLFFTTIIMMMIASIFLAACGGTAAPASAPAPEVEVEKPDYQATGETIRLTRIHDADPVTDGDQPSVMISLSRYDSDDPSIATPIGVSMKGRKGYETEGINIDFSWNLTELYQPDLYDHFDSLCNFHWDATISGRPAIVQNKGEGVDACWIEFTFSD